MLSLVVVEDSSSQDVVAADVGLDGLALVEVLGLVVVLVVLLVSRQLPLAIS